MDKITGMRVFVEVVNLGSLTAAAGKLEMSRSMATRSCIIYYNSALLSNLIEKFEQEGNQDVVNLIAGLSPVAWRHIQLAGNYTFGIQKENIVLEKLLENLKPWREDSMIELVA